MTHRCHWPGCDRYVPPRMWGCRPHWFTLPIEIRRRIWAAYRSGQEVTKTPSKAYLAAAAEAQEWALAYEKEKRAREPAPARPRSLLPDQPRFL